MNLPNDIQYKKDEMFYKKGIHNLVFRWDGDQWVKSEREWPDIVKGKKASMINGRLEVEGDKNKSR